MKIQGYGMQGLNPYSNTKRTAPAKETSESFKDKLEISSAAKDMTVASQYSTERAEKVQKLKADIQSGNYQVNAKQVAEDMLKYYKF